MSELSDAVVRPNHFPIEMTYSEARSCAPVMATSDDVLTLGLRLAEARCAGPLVHWEGMNLWFANRRLRPSRSPADTYFVLWQVKKLVAFLNADARPIVTVEQLAGVLGHSRSHFTRTFKNSFGVPPAMFLIHRRFEKIRWMMRHSPLRLTDIALQFGFCDQSHFCRSFKRQTGMSPRAWRSGHLDVTANERRTSHPAFTQHAEAMSN